MFAPWGQGRRTLSWLPAEGPAPRDAGPRTYLQAPAPRCADSDLPGQRLEGSAPCVLVAPGVCPASPSDSLGSQAPPSRAGQSALPAPALAHAAANKRARHGPPPPAGGGRRGGGRVRPPPAQESGSWKRKREGGARGLRQWKRRPRTSIKPEGSLCDGGRVRSPSLNGGRLYWLISLRP